MAGGATIGATTAVDMQGNKASEKVISYMREEMAATAEKRGRDKYIARGMVDEELEFPNKVMKEFINDGEVIDTIKTKVYYLVIDGDTVTVDDIEGRKQGNLITLTTEQSLKYKIADASIENFEAVLDTLGFSNLVVNKTTENWSENFVRFLTNPVVASLLTTFGFLGILFELQSPGWGIPGSIGLICLILSLSASYIAELATMSDLLVVLMGMLFLMLEAFVFPGFGLAGVAGIVFILWGLYLLLLPDVPVGEEVLSQASNGLIIGISPRIGTFDVNLFDESNINPPINNVSPSCTRTEVLVDLVDIIGLWSLPINAIISWTTASIFILITLSLLVRGNTSRETLTSWFSYV